jgi:hypothetical protein
MSLFTFSNTVVEHLVFLATHGLENSVVWCQPGPDGATLQRCDVNVILLTVMEKYTNVTIKG